MSIKFIIYLRLMCIQVKLHGNCNAIHWNIVICFVLRVRRPPAARFHFHNEDLRIAFITITILIELNARRRRQMLFDLRFSIEIYRFVYKNDIDHHQLNMINH